MISIIKPIGIFLLTIFTISSVHWCSIWFLYNYCQVSGLFGLLQHSIMLGSPVCHFVNHVQLSLSNHYITIWTCTAATCVSWCIHSSMTNK